MIRVNIEAPSVEAFAAVMASLRGAPLPVGAIEHKDFQPSFVLPEPKPRRSKSVEAAAVAEVAPVEAVPVKVVPTEAAEVASEAAEAPDAEPEAETASADINLAVRALLMEVRNKFTPAAMMDLIAQAGGKSVKDVPPAALPGLLAAAQAKLAAG